MIIPLNSIVVMIGTSCSNRTTITNEYFDDYEIVSFEKTSFLFSGKKYDSLNKKAILNEMKRLVEIKLMIGERVIIDNTNLDSKNRKFFIDLSKKYKIPIFYIFVDKLNNIKNESQKETLESNLSNIKCGDNFATFIDDISKIDVVQKPNKSLNYIDERFSGITAIGDVHGMLEPLKNAIEWSKFRNTFCVFLGDIIDYGPYPLECIDIVYDVITRGKGVMVIGNHEHKIENWFNDDRTTLSKGNKVTTDIFEKLPDYYYNQYVNKFKTIMNLSRNFWTYKKYVFSHGATTPTMINNDEVFGKDRMLSLYGSDLSNSSKKFEWVSKMPSDVISVVGHQIISNIPYEYKADNGSTAWFLDTGSGKGGKLSSIDIINNIITNSKLY